MTAFIFYEMDISIKVEFIRKNKSKLFRFLSRDGCLGLVSKQIGFIVNFNENKN